MSDLDGLPVKQCQDLCQASGGIDVVVDDQDATGQARTDAGFTLCAFASFSHSPNPCLH
jgi:hypothetical protein